MARRAKGDKRSSSTGSKPTSVAVPPLVHGAKLAVACTQDSTTDAPPAAAAAAARTPNAFAGQVTDDNDDDDPVERLVAWLRTQRGFVCELEARDVKGAGRGLYTKRALAPHETILQIPSSAMLNPLTLTTTLIPPSLIPRPPVNPHKRIRLTSPGRARGGNENTAGPAAAAPPGPLNTTQVLTLEVALSKQAQGPWDSFMRTLPHSFRPWHPLTWVVDAGERAEGTASTEGKSKSKCQCQNGDGGENKWTRWAELADLLDGYTKRKLEDVKARWETDRDTLRKALRYEAFTHLKEPVSAETLLWAWLNVNTRTVSIALGLAGDTALYNHTFVPLLDMINHSSSPSLRLGDPVQVASGPARASTGPTYARAHLGPGPNGPARTGMLGRHGRTPTPTPPAAAGKIDFRMSAPARGLERGKQVHFAYGPHASSVLFAEYGFHEYAPDASTDGADADAGGEIDVGEHVRRLWAEHGTDDKREALEAIACWGHDTLHLRPEPHAAYALVMTLRVLFLDSADADKLASVRRGLVSYVSPANEARARAALNDLCEETVREADAGLARVRRWVDDLDGDHAVQGAVRLVRGLWTERRDVASAVLKSIDRKDGLD
ncbi:hypothetical protein Q5752_003208 [Cryptotrichosporon argae]